MNNLNYDTVFVHRLNGLTRINLRSLSACLFVHRLNGLTQISKNHVNPKNHGSDNWGDSTSESYGTRHPSPTGLDASVKNELFNEIKQFCIMNRR
jgi:hypothetical protein